MGKKGIEAETKDSVIRVHKTTHILIARAAADQGMTIKDYIQAMTDFFQKNGVSVKDEVNFSLQQLIATLKDYNEKGFDRVFKFLKTQEKNYLEPMLQGQNKSLGFLEFLMSNQEVNLPKEAPKLDDRKVITIPGDTQKEIQTLKLKAEKAETISKQLIEILVSDFLNKGNSMNKNYVVTLTPERKAEIENFVTRAKTEFEKYVRDDIKG